MNPVIELDGDGPGSRWVVLAATGPRGAECAREAAVLARVTGSVGSTASITSGDDEGDSSATVVRHGHLAPGVRVFCVSPRRGHTRLHHKIGTVEHVYRSGTVRCRFDGVVDGMGNPWVWNLDPSELETE